MGRGLLALAVLAFATTGCNESFECAADSHCQSDGVAGFCESIGHCSFPDEECETGRRFGELAGTLSNMCVPPDEAMTSGQVESTGNAGSSSGGITTSLPDATTGSDPGSSTSGSSDESSTGSTGSNVPADCNILFEDTFEGDVLGETWSVIGEPPTVSAGALRYIINPEAGTGYPSASVLSGTPLNLSDGWVTVNLEAVPQILRTQGTINLEFDGHHAMVLYESGGLGPFFDGESIEHTATTAPWVRVALESSSEGTDLAIYESEDGDTFVEVARRAGIPADPTGVEVNFKAGAYDDFAIPQEFAIRSVTVCGRSGL